MPKTKSETAPKEASPPPDQGEPESFEALVQQLEQALGDANAKIEELRNANEVLTYENTNLNAKLEQNGLLIAECENLKREFEETKNTYKGILRFLHDPANSHGEKAKLIERELAKP